MTATPRHACASCEGRGEDRLGQRCGLCGGVGARTEAESVKPGAYRADRHLRLRRFWCPVCNLGIVLAAWIEDAFCGYVVDAEGKPSGVYGDGRGCHPLARCRPLDLDHAADPTEGPPALYESKDHRET